MQKHLRLLGCHPVRLGISTYSDIPGLIALRNGWCHLIRFATIGVALLLGDIADGEVRYRNQADQAVRGIWTLDLAGGVELVDDTYAMDLNADGSNDLQLTHGYVASTSLVSPAAGPYIEASLSGLHQVLGRLRETRTLALAAADFGGKDLSTLADLQLGVHQRLDAIDSIVSNTQYLQRTLLDGSSGILATASDPDRVQVLRATYETQPGVYPIQVTEAARRAEVVAAEAQSERLAADEILTINGFAIQLFEGLLPWQVRRRINQFTSQSGAVSDVIVRDGQEFTRLYSIAGWGSSSRIEVISNRANDSSGQVSGFGTEGGSFAGQDVVATFNGVRVPGIGPSIVSGSSETLGLGLIFHADPQSMSSTYSGDMGLITVVDQSLKFASSEDSERQVRVTLPNVRPESLGVGDVGNPFFSLREIKLVSADTGSDAVRIIDAAQNQVEAEITRISGYLDITTPVSMNHWVGLAGTQILTRVGEIALLQPGEIVGPGDRFRTGGFEVAPGESGFIGLEIPTEMGVNYGWVGFATDHEHGVVIRDYAFETAANTPIRVGASSSFPSAFDLNADGEFDVLDLDLLTIGISTDLGNNPLPSRYDLNGDGSLSDSDVEIWLAIAAEQNGYRRPYSNGDLNLDGRVDTADLNRMGQNWGRWMDGWSHGDLVLDGKIDFLDLNELGQNWMVTIPSSAAAAVPEPTPLTWGLLGLGTVLVVLRKPNREFR